MTDSLRVGVQLRPQHTEFRDLRVAAIRAEELGVDVVYTWDHFFPLHGGKPDKHTGKHFECWTTLACFAEVTERVEIGPLVTCNSYRNPDLLADMARTVDHISGGRLILGIGAGWFEKDYREYGYEFGTAGYRLAELEKALPRIESRLAVLDPPPVRHIPILVGGGGEKKTLRYAARHADIWHGFGDPAKFTRKSRILDEWCAREGTDPAAIERSVDVSGDVPAAVGDALVAAGATQFTIELDGPDYDMGAVSEWLAWRDERNR